MKYSTSKNLKRINYIKMAFIKKKINIWNIWIIDIWTHKIKVGIYSIIWNESELLWYWEKRQDSDYSYLGEYLDIEWICSNISDAILKAEKQSKVKINNIIINYPFEEIFFCYKKINHNRKNNTDVILTNEYNSILKKVDDFSIRSNLKDISCKSSYLIDDLKQIIHNISDIQVDGFSKLEIVGSLWSNINFSVLNIFIPISKYNLLHYIWNVLNKKILKIVPLEFSLVKFLSDKKDLIIIDIWNSHISIIIKKWGNLIGVSKIPLWIDDLIGNIQESTGNTKIDIINSIDLDIFIEEKKEFLWILEDCLVVWLRDIINEDICPSSFFITWWGWNNFIKEYFKSINLNNKGLKIIGDISILDLEKGYTSPWNKNITTNILSLASIVPYLL